MQIPFWALIVLVVIFIALFITSITLTSIDADKQSTTHINSVFGINITLTILMFITTGLYSESLTSSSSYTVIMLNLALFMSIIAASISSLQKLS